MKCRPCDRDMAQTRDDRALTLTHCCDRSTGGCGQTVTILPDSGYVPARGGFVPSPEVAA